MKFVYFVTRGASDPTLASIPLHMAANGSLEVGHDVAVLFAGDGSEILIGENAQTMEGVGVPPVRDLLAKLKSGGASVYV
jgi:predicted peroxiredoxin